MRLRRPARPEPEKRPGSETPKSTPPGWQRSGLAVVAGFLLFLAFPPFDLSFLVFAGMVPLYAAAFGGANPRRQFGIGYLGGAAFSVFHLHWLMNLAKDEIPYTWIMIPALLVVGAYLGIFPGIAVAVSGALQRRTGLSPLWSFPLTWTLCDWFRCLGETAFPWGSLGYALAPRPEALQITSIAGYWFLPAWIVFVNGLLWRLLVERGRRLRFALAAAVVILLPIVYGTVVLRSADSGLVPVRAGDPRKLEPPARRFCLIQANTPREIKWKIGYRALVVNDLLERTKHAAEAYQPDLIVWPETAAPLRLLWEPALAQQTAATIDSLDTWTLVGTLDARVVEDREEHFNSAVLFDPEGTPVRAYNKRNMVPFGELTPYRRRLPLLAKLDFGQSEFTRGQESGTFTLAYPDGPAKFSCLICFESTFPELARGDVRDGAQFLVNITNDFWYGRSSGPLQHARFAIHRAVENRVPLLRCANSGVSMLVDPYGRVLAETEIFVEEYVTAEAHPGRGSFYTRSGDWILGLWGLLLVLGTVRARGWARRGR